MSGFKTTRILFIALALMALETSEADAGTIVGGSALLGPADVTQLETWLGEGPLVLTNVFTRKVGDGQTSTDFHGTVDGLGRTFVAARILETRGNSAQTVGGYNPQSWHSSGSYNLTPIQADRTAFLFNLITTLPFPQLLGSVRGQYQTYNQVNYGPTFGGGHDIYVDSSLGSGYVFGWSYPLSGLNLLGSGSRVFVDHGTIEVFTIELETVATRKSTWRAVKSLYN